MNFKPLLFFLSFVLLFSSCENDIEKVKLVGKGENEPVETAVNIKIIYSDSARVKAELTSPRTHHYIGENAYMELPQGFKATFYNERLEVKSWLTADYGIRYEKEQKMEASKNVVAVNQNGDQLNTEHLVWDERREKLLSDEFVKITTKDEIIYGSGFEANQDFSKYKIFNIKGTISIRK